MKLHVQNLLYTSISFEILKGFRPLWACLGMPDHILNLHNQFITLIDMKLHAQNQIFTFFSF